jgi:hypothetical protein
MEPLGTSWPGEDRTVTRKLAELRPRQRPPVSARALSPVLPDTLRKHLEAAETALAEPFKGISVDGRIRPGLFPVAATGISTLPIREAAAWLLASLSPAQRGHACFPLESDRWRRWSNIHPYLMRHGVCLEELSAAQRGLALRLVSETLSPRGFRTARDVMKLNEFIREVTGRGEEYGEWLYWLSLMGTPSADEPWGWQIDGHHLIVNCLVLGDQVVLTPLFMGSEPVARQTGASAGIRVFEAEESGGLALIRALTESQQRKAVLSPDLPPEVFSAAFRDNLELGYQGVAYGELSGAQRGLLRTLIETYVGRIRPGHAEVKAAEVNAHLAETHFAWMGGVDEDSVFYYRVHSPVILVEFDHQRGIALDNDQPSRNHIHTVVRTPNGNDYGKDLLRQHHERFRHASR